jgi:DNA-directed RNA polymerase subunit RPC12/RpoP
MHEQTVVSIKDLRFATLRCPHCRTRVTLDLALSLGYQGRSASLAPDQCPRCGSALHSNVAPGLEHLQKAYALLAKLGNSVTFTANDEMSEDGTAPGDPPAKTP